MPECSATAAKATDATSETNAPVDKKATGASVWADALPTGQTTVRFELLRKSAALTETAAWVATASSANAPVSATCECDQVYIPNPNILRHIPLAVGVICRHDTARAARQATRQRRQEVEEDTVVDDSEEDECHGRSVLCLFVEVVIIRYDKEARDRGIVHMIVTRARTSPDRT